MSNEHRLDFESAKRRLAEALARIESEDGPLDTHESILRRRARELAHPLESDTEETGDTVVVFRLGSTRYALPLSSIAEVTAHPRIAPAPGAPAEIAGLLQVRGEIRPVWDLRRILGLEILPESGNDGSVLLLHAANGRGQRGLLVDEVEDIRVVSQSGRQPVPGPTDFAAWVTDDGVTALDIENVFTSGGRREQTT